MHVGNHMCSGISKLFRSKFNFIERISKIYIKCTKCALNFVCIVRNAMFHKVTFKKPIRTHNKGFIINPKLLPSLKFSPNLAAFAKVDIWRIFPDLAVQWAAALCPGAAMLALESLPRLGGMPVHGAPILAPPGK